MQELSGCPTGIGVMYCGDRETALKGPCNVFVGLSMMIGAGRRNLLEEPRGAAPRQFNPSLNASTSAHGSPVNTATRHAGHPRRA